MPQQIILDNFIDNNRAILSIEPGAVGIKFDLSQTGGKGYVFIHIHDKDTFAQEHSNEANLWYSKVGAYEGLFVFITALESATKEYLNNNPDVMVSVMKMLRKNEIERVTKLYNEYSEITNKIKMRLVSLQQKDEYRYVGDEALGFVDCL